MREIMMYFLAHFTGVYQQTVNLLKSNGYITIIEKKYKEKRSTLLLSFWHRKKM